MLINLSRSHRKASKTVRWASLLIGAFVIVCWLMLIMGNLTMDLSLDNGFQLNAYLVVVAVAVLLTFIVYGISFVTIYISLCLLSILKTQSKQET